MGFLDETGAIARDRIFAVGLMKAAEPGRLLRAAASLASEKSVKAELSRHIRSALGTASCLTGWRNQRHSVAVYDHGQWSDRRLTP